MSTERIQNSTDSSGDLQDFRILCTPGVDLHSRKLLCIFVDASLSSIDASWTIWRVFWSTQRTVWSLRSAPWGIFTRRTAVRASTISTPFSQAEVTDSRDFKRRVKNLAWVDMHNCMTVWVGCWRKRGIPSSGRTRTEIHRNRNTQTKTN